mgnify:CR=1 FL=1
MKTKSNKGLVIALILACLLIALVPLFALKGAEFGGSDDAGGDSFSVRQSLIIKVSWRGLFLCPSITNHQEEFSGETSRLQA